MAKKTISQEWQEQRNELSNKIRSFRKAMREHGPVNTNFNSLVRQFFSQQFSDVPSKPTRDNLFRAAVGYLEASKVPVKAHGDEYYSCCGLDDMEAEQRDAYRSEFHQIMAELYPTYSFRYHEAIVAERLRIEERIAKRAERESAGLHQPEPELNSDNYAGI